MRIQPAVGGGGREGFVTWACLSWKALRGMGWLLVPSPSWGTQDHEEGGGLSHPAPSKGLTEALPGSTATQHGPCWLQTLHPDSLVLGSPRSRQGPCPESVSLSCLGKPFVKCVPRGPNAPQPGKNGVPTSNARARRKGFWAENVHSPFPTMFFSDSHTVEPLLRKQKAHCPQALTSGSQGCPPGTHQHHQKKIPSVTPHKAYRDLRYGGDQTDPALEWFSLTWGDGADIYETWKRLPAAERKQAWCKTVPWGWRAGQGKPSRLSAPSPIFNPSLACGARFSSTKSHASQDSSAEMYTLLGGRKRTRAREEEEVPEREARPSMSREKM